MIAEWIPENPCDNCTLTYPVFAENPLCKGLDSLCTSLKTYNSEVAAQRKLLEYLIANDTNCKYPDNLWYMRPNNRKVLESMLKQLEGANRQCINVMAVKPTKIDKIGSEMRMIPDGKFTWQFSGNVHGEFYKKGDTIEITNGEWDEIGKDYVDNYEYGLFEEGYAVWRGLSQYLRDLISLRE